MMQSFETEQAFNRVVEAARMDMGRENGTYYKSALEGYGDVSRMLLALQDDVKGVRKAVADLVDWVGGADAEQLIRSLGNAREKAMLLAYQSVGMVAMLRRFEETVRDATGGDLIDMLEDEDE